MNRIKVKEEFFKDYEKVESKLKTVNPEYEKIEFEIIPRTGHFLLIANKSDDLLQKYIFDLCNEPQLFEKIEIF